jgi:hypothetical protein
LVPPYTQGGIPKIATSEYLEGMLGEDTFNKSGVMSTASTYLKYQWDMYRVHLQKNPRYEHLPMISKREYKALIKDSKENGLRLERKTPLGPAR